MIMWCLEAARERGRPFVSHQTHTHASSTRVVRQCLQWWCSLYESPYPLAIIQVVRVDTHGAHVLKQLQQEKWCSRVCAKEWGSWGLTGPT